MTQTAFILSTGRTGTKFLAEYFSTNFDNVLALHEPKPSYLLRIYSNAHLSGHVSQQAMITLLRLMRRKRLHELSSDLYIEANPFITGFLDVLPRVWPDPTIIHIVRDPRTYVRSANNHGSYSGTKWLVAQIIPYWFLNIRKLLGIDAKLSPVGIFAGSWVLVNRWLYRTGSTLSNYHLIRFEDIFDDSFSGLRRLCRILGLKYPETAVRVPPTRKINPGRLRRLGPWREWPDAQCHELHRICSPLMQEYGYGKEAEWLARVGKPDLSQVAQVTQA